jgi:hypothetical protein
MSLWLECDRPFGIFGGGIIFKAWKDVGGKHQEDKLWGWEIGETDPELCELVLLLTMFCYKVVTMLTVAAAIPILR